MVRPSKGTTKAARTSLSASVNTHKGSSHRGTLFKGIVALGVMFALIRGSGISCAVAGGGIRASSSSAIEALPSKTRELEVTDTCLSLQTGPDPVDLQLREWPDPTQDKRKCQLYTKPTLYIDLLMTNMVGFPNHGTCVMTVPNCVKHAPYVEIARKYGLDWAPFGYTMVGKARLENFRAAIEEVNRNQIPGDIMELGVWRGGAMIMATAVQKEYKDRGGTMDREMYVLDAFEKIPARSYGANHEYLFNTEESVRENFKIFDVHDSNVHFITGLFKDTVPGLSTRTNGNPSISQIAVLRVDGNFYDSYQDALYHTYGMVPVGGIVIFDDVMSHVTVMQCWNDFKADQGLTEDLNRIDVHSAWFRKETDVTIDMSKMHPPQDVNIA